MLGLSDLVAPLDAEEFLSGHWPERPWHVASGDERPARLLESARELESAKAAMAGASPVRVFKPDGTFAAVPNGDAAWPLYMLGLTCYVSAAHVRGLDAVLERLTAELGLPAGSMEAEIFCSDGKSGARMHSDFDLNFALLLRGRKRWRIAPNEHIRNQTGVCVPSTREQVSPIQLELADRTPFPAEMPEDAVTVDVESGGVVFLPRGWWHETEADGECLQVNFVVKRPMWLRVLSGAIEMELMRDPQWRAFALDLFSAGERGEQAVARLAELLPGARERLDGLLGGEDAQAAARRVIERSGLRAVSPKG